MKATTTTHKTLVHKQSQEFGMYMGEGQFGTSYTPKLLSDEATMTGLRTYVERFEGDAAVKAFDNEAHNYEIKTVVVTLEL